MHRLSLKALPCRHRFSAKKKSHGWCDFGPSSTVLDSLQRQHTAAPVVTADIQTLQESISFARDGELSGGSNLAGVGTGEVLGGKYTWKLHNFSMFRETVRAWCRARPWRHWPGWQPHLEAAKNVVCPGTAESPLGPSQLGHQHGSTGSSYLEGPCKAGSGTRDLPVRTSPCSLPPDPAPHQTPCCTCCVCPGVPGAPAP